MEIRDFQNLKVGDYVQLVELNESDVCSSDHLVNSSMIKYGGNIAQIIRLEKNTNASIYSNYAYIDLDDCCWNWFPSLIARKLTKKEAKEVEKERNKHLPIIVNTFDKVRIVDDETLKKNYGDWSGMRRYANRTFTISKVFMDYPDRKYYTFSVIETDTRFRNNDIAEVIEKFSWKKTKPTPIEVENAEIEINDKFRIQNIAFAKITKSIKKIVDSGNSIKFAKIIADKMVVIDASTNRIMTDCNKHIQNELGANGCSGWRIDNIDNIITNKIDMPFEDYDKMYIKIKIDYVNKSYEIVELDPNDYCSNCGANLNYYAREGKYCSRCLDNYTQRYGYHDFAEPYKVYENVDTTKTLVFGTENERDYINDRERDDIDFWNEEDRDDYICSYDNEDAWDELDLDSETYEQDTDYWDERIEELVEQRRNELAEEYDENHPTEDDYYSDFEDDMTRACEQVFRTLQGDQIENGTLRRENVFMSDGSLNHGGVEWITFPHTFDWYVANKDKIQDALDVFEDYGFTNTESTGNHIHMNKDFFKINGVDYGDFCASKIAVLFNKYWKQFCKIANRVRTDYTSCPAQTATDTPEVIVSKTQRSKGDHCVAVNLQHDKTIEIRLWNGIRSADELIFFLDNMQALARYVKTTSLEKVQVAKMTDYMKYYKLDSSLHCARGRIAELTDAKSKSIVETIDKMIDKRNKKAGK